VRDLGGGVPFRAARMKERRPPSRSPAGARAARNVIVLCRRAVSRISGSSPVIYVTRRKPGRPPSPGSGATQPECRADGRSWAAQGVRSGTPERRVQTATIGPCSAKLAQWRRDARGACGGRSRPRAPAGLIRDCAQKLAPQLCYCNEISLGFKCELNPPTDSKEGLGVSLLSDLFPNQFRGSLGRRKR
jgi:hypothetical protein